MGKSYLDVNSTKDTLSFSFGKDSKVSVERTRVKEKSKIKTIGSRQKFEVTWEIKIKNNGGAMIPLIVKDQYPVSNQEDIKVKQGELVDGKVMNTLSQEDKNEIIEWLEKDALPFYESQNMIDKKGEVLNLLKEIK